jgi:uncharacterized protein (UPF0261 family)
MATKLNRARGPTAVVIPGRGFSPGNREGRALYDPEADRAFIDALSRNIRPPIRLLEVDAHINDAAFAENAANVLGQLMGVSL